MDGCKFPFTLFALVTGLARTEMASLQYVRRRMRPYLPITTFGALMSATTSVIHPSARLKARAISDYTYPVITNDMIRDLVAADDEFNSGAYTVTALKVRYFRYVRA